jgi:hypothetical protein
MPEEGRYVCDAAWPTGRALIDDTPWQHAPGLLMSLNMLIETKARCDFTEADRRVRPFG